MKETPAGPLVRPASRVEGDLRARIQSGTWPIGTKMASRRKLSQEYGVALGTVERAIDGLIAEGLLRADSRSGTFVVRTEAASVDAPGFVEEEEITPHAPPLPSLGVIADVVPDQREAAFGETWTRFVVQAMESVFVEAGGVTSFLNRARSEDEHRSMSDALEEMRTRGVDCLALINLHDSMSDIAEVTRAVDLDRCPVVCVAAGEISLPIPHLFYDQRFAGYQAAEHLLSRGYREISVLAPFRAPWLEDRITGIRQAIANEGLPETVIRLFPENPAPAPSDHERQGYEAMRALLRSQSWPGAVIAANDVVAFGGIQAAQEAGLIAGRDYAIIGFDDHWRSLSVGLSTLRPPLEALGGEAARLLLAALRGRNAGMQIRLRSHLIPRASTLDSALGARRRPGIVTRKTF